MTRDCHSSYLKYKKQWNGNVVSTLIKPSLMETDTIQLEMELWASGASIMVYVGSSATCHKMTTMQTKQEISFQSVDAYFNFLQICPSVLSTSKVSKVSVGFYSFTENFNYTLVILLIYKKISYGTSDFHIYWYHSSVNNPRTNLYYRACNVAE